MRTAVQVASWSHRLYIKEVEIVFNIQSLVEASCFPLQPLSPNIKTLRQAAGTLQEPKTSATLEYDDNERL